MARSRLAAALLIAIPGILLSAPAPARAADDDPVPPAPAPAPGPVQSPPPAQAAPPVQASPPAKDPPPAEGSLEATLSRIDALRTAGDNEAALAETEKALGQARAELSLHVRRQDLMTALGRKEQALEIYRDHAAGAPNDARRMYLVARLLPPEQAMKELRRALEADPALVPAWQDLSGLYSVRRQWKDAADAIQHAADLRDDASLRNQLGWLRERAGQLDEALAAYRAALERDPSYSLARRNMAYVLVRRGKPEEAAALLEEALTKTPSDALAWVALGYVRASTKDLLGAKKAYESALASAPPDAAILDLLGTTYLGMERADLAEDAFQKALAVRPDDPTAHLHLGAIRLDDGDVEGAEKEFRAAARARPSPPQASFYLGSLCDRTDRTDEALLWYRKAAEAEPGNASFASSFAIALEAKGRYPEALQWWKRAAEASPGDPDLLLGEGVVLARMKRWKDAEEVLQSVLAVRAKDLRALFFLGVVEMEGMKSPDGARAYFQRYVDLGGDPEPVKPWFTDIVKRATPEEPSAPKEPGKDSGRPPEGR